MRRTPPYAAATLGWFAASLLALAAAWAVVADRCVGLRDPEWAVLRDRMRQRLAESPGAGLTVVFGSSRGQTGLRAGRMSRPDSVAFNACVAGGGVLTQRALLERLLADGVRPRCVVLEVMPAFLADPDAEDDHLEASRLSLAEADAALAAGVRSGSLAWSWLVGRLRPPAPAGHDRDPHGWKRRLSVPPERREALVTMNLHQYRRALAGTTLCPRRSAALMALVRRCRAEGIEVVLYLGPEHSRMRAASRADLAGLLAEGRRLGARVCDARDWLPDDAFHDAHHPAIDGADALSARFAAEVLGR